VGTRPNYIKITQFKKVAAQHFPGKFNIKLVHTGQHFDKAMADVFFKQLDIEPDYFLNISSLSANIQMAEIMLRLEPLLNEFKPDWVIVPGDVNSTLAAALAAHKCGYKIAHLESGLRSFDRTMPEEINRIITDEISNLFFVTEQSGLDNLKREGKDAGHIFFVGNTMIDTMVAFEEEIAQNKILERIGLQMKEYALVTMHRPATVDNKEGLTKLCNLLQELSNKVKVLFPIHPRTKAKLTAFELLKNIEDNQRIIFTEPLDYFAFQNLISNALFIVTDSGGIQEETTFKKIPCLTLRENTERPITITEGSNSLSTLNEDDVLKKAQEIMDKNYKKGKIPALWDGYATNRILAIFNSIT
jgi:UDP-N-acetylglucosamine 2-epimerase (non-hydrolysing)